MNFLIAIVTVFVIGLILSFTIIINFSKPSSRHSSTPKDDNLKVEVVNIPTENNKELFGWWLPSDKKSPTIILVHGWDRNVSLLVPYLNNLQNKGFNLLAFDTRHHGNSDNDKFSSMVKYAQDISACINFIENKPTVENDNFFLIGLSIGGAASIYAATTDKRIKKIVTVGAPANPAKVMGIHIRKKHIPQPIIWLAFTVMEYRIGKTFAELASDKNISKTTAKVLLIHGTDDKTVPFSQASLIKNAATPGQATLWAIDGKGHSNCHYEKDFWNTIVKFLG